MSLSAFTLVCPTCSNYRDTPYHEYACPDGSQFNVSGTRQIYGPAQIPSAYPHHVHASEEARVIAEKGLILLTLVGSGTHGTAVSGQDDRDEMGICLEPSKYVTGLARVPAGDTRTIPFEQFERHTAWDRPGGVKNRSGAGDLDTIIYSLRKWARLAKDGNPTVLLPLFVPDKEVIFRNRAGVELVDNYDKFISKRALSRFLGYLHDQRGGMTGIGHTNRPELVELYGYDTKFAMHALRLAYQGIELAETGKITLPVRGGTLEILREVREGKYKLNNVLVLIEALENRLRELTQTSQLPPEPDHKWIDEWLHQTYMDYWKREK